MYYLQRSGRGCRGWPPATIRRLGLIVPLVLIVLDMSSLQVVGVVGVKAIMPVRGSNRYNRHDPDNLH